MGDFWFNSLFFEMYPVKALKRRIVDLNDIRLQLEHVVSNTVKIKRRKEEWEDQLHRNSLHY